MTTPVFIQAVPWLPQRTKRAVEVARETGGTIVWDSQRSAFETFKDVLRAIGDGSAVLLEDDVRLATGWREKVEAVIAEHPDEVINFFSIRPVPAGFYEAQTYGGNVCCYFPAGDAASLLGWFSDRDSPFLRDYHDLSVGRWLAKQGRGYWQASPSLVQHEPWVSVVLPHRSRKRQSATFEG